MARMRRDMVVAGVLAVVAFAAVGALLIRLGVFAPASPDEARRREVQAQVRDRRSEGERSYAKLGMMPALPETGRSEVVGVFEPLFASAIEAAHERVAGEVSISQADREALAGLAAGFVYSRFFSGDPHQYVRWRLSTGSRWVLSEKLAAIMIPEDWAFFFPDEPFPGLDDPAVVFARMWDRQAAIETIVVAGIADEPGAVAAEFALETWPDLGWPELADRDGIVWTGQKGGMRRWFEPADHSFREFTERARPIVLATVAFIVEHGDGRRDPIAMHAYKGPSGRWVVHSVGFTNTGGSAPIAQEM